MVSNQQAVSDAVGITDIQKKAINKALSDGIIVTDSQLKGVLKSVSDGFSVTESLTNLQGFNLITPNPQKGSEQNKKPFDVLSTSLIVDSDTYYDIACVDYRDYIKSLLSFYNSDAANGLTLSVYGSNNFNNGTPPPFDTSWQVLTNGQDVALAALTPYSVGLTDEWVWILVRAKRTVAGTDANALNINITARKH